MLLQASENSFFKEEFLLKGPDSRMSADGKELGIIGNASKETHSKTDKTSAVKESHPKTDKTSAVKE